MPRGLPSSHTLVPAAGIAVCLWQHVTDCWSYSELLEKLQRKKNVSGTWWAQQGAEQSWAGDGTAHAGWHCTLMWEVLGLSAPTHTQLWAGCFCQEEERCNGSMGRCTSTSRLVLCFSKEQGVFSSGCEFSLLNPTNVCQAFVEQALLLRIKK